MWYVLCLRARVFFSLFLFLTLNLQFYKIFFTFYHKTEWSVVCRGSVVLVSPSRSHFFLFLSLEWATLCVYNVYRPTHKFVVAVFLSLFCFAIVKMFTVHVVNGTARVQFFCFFLHDKIVWVVCMCMCCCLSPSLSFHNSHRVEYYTQLV